MPLSVQWHRIPDVAELRRRVAQDVRSAISHAVQERGEALVAFPGGSTPVPILEALAAMDLPWAKVTVIPSDDRLVPLSSPLSNVAVLTRLFAGLGARVLSLGEDAANYQRTGREADAMLHQLAWPPDLVWLGVGQDGHTASIFAGPDLERALRPMAGERAVGVRPDPLPPEAPVNRVTLTAPAIAEARRVIVVIGGGAKLRVLEEAVADEAGSAYPIARVLARTPGAVLYAPGV